MWAAEGQGALELRPLAPAVRHDLELRVVGTCIDLTTPLGSFVSVDGANVAIPFALPAEVSRCTGLVQVLVHATAVDEFDARIAQIHAARVYVLDPAGPSPTWLDEPTARAQVEALTPVGDTYEDVYVGAEVSR